MPDLAVQPAFDPGPPRWPESACVCRASCLASPCACRQTVTHLRPIWVNVADDPNPIDHFPAILRGRDVDKIHEAEVASDFCLDHEVSLQVHVMRFAQLVEVCSQGIGDALTGIVRRNSCGAGDNVVDLMAQ